jgi:hypothetical protein
MTEQRLRACNRAGAAEEPEPQEEVQTVRPPRGNVGVTTALLDTRGEACGDCVTVECLRDQGCAKEEAMTCEGWTEGIPREPGWYWIRWRLGEDPNDRRFYDSIGLDIPIKTGGARSYVRGVISVTTGPRGGKRQPKWVTRHRPLFDIPGGAYDVRCKRCEEQPGFWPAEEGK